MRFNTPAPEDIVRWYRKGVPGGGQKDRIFDRLKAKLTGGTDDSGTSYFKMHDRQLTQADADYLISNMKKDEDGYPMLETGSTSGEDERRYQEWLLERYLEVPFREQTNEKIKQAEVRTRVKEILEIDRQTKDVAPEVEEPAQLVAVVEDKVDAIEAIREEIAPPRSEYQPPEDPWGEGSIPPKVEAAVKKTKKKASKRKKRTAPGASKAPKKPFVSKMGGSVRKTTGKFNGVFDFMEKGSPGGENQGPSVLAIGAFFGRKIQSAFDEAAEERARAVEAEANGAEIPPEMKEKGYFLKKSLGYQFGGEAVNKTLGVFAEDLPSKQSRKKAGFGDTFDYGDSDPRKQKRQDSVKDLATGFRKVDRSLRQINSSLSKNAGILTQLVAESTRTADAAESIAQQLAKGVDLEIQTGDVAQQAQQAAEGFDSPLSLILGNKKGSNRILDTLFALDDIRDISRGFRGTKSKGMGGKTNITGDINGRNRARNLNPFSRSGGGSRITGGKPKFRLPKRFKFSEGGAVAGAVPAMVGEAGKEFVDRAGVRETLPKGFTPDDTMVRPFVKVMETPMMVIGAQISDAISAVVKAAGPFSGVLASMFSPMTSGLSQMFGIPQSAFAADLKSSSMTEEKGAKALGSFLAPLFKMFGLEGDASIDDPGDGGGFKGDIEWTKDPAFASAVNQVAKNLDVSASDLMGLMASESGLDPKANNGTHVGLIQFSAASARASGTSQSALLKMSRAEQMPYVQEYLENAGLPRKASAGQLYTAVFLPAFVGKPDDFVVAAKDGSLPSGYERVSPAWYRPNAGLDADNDGRITIRELGERIQKKKSEFNIPAEKGVAKTASFMNNVDGIWRMEGPDSGYRVPQELTGDKKVIGHGLEWLMKFPNKFVILPGVNKAYNVYTNPEKAFNRYETIASKASVNQEGLTDTMSQIIFGMSDDDRKPERVINKRGREIRRQLPEAKITPIPIPKDTASGTVGGGQTVAIVQPSIQYVPVPGPVQTVVESVPANIYAAARKNADMQYLQSLS